MILPHLFRVAKTGYMRACCSVPRSSRNNGQIHRATNFVIQVFLFYSKEN